MIVFPSRRITAGLNVPADSQPEPAGDRTGSFERRRNFDEPAARSAVDEANRRASNVPVKGNGRVGRAIVHHLAKELYFLAAESFSFAKDTLRTMPSPSFTYTNWFTATSFNASTVPLGQRISSRSTFCAFPRPKCTRRSFCEK